MTSSDIIEEILIKSHSLGIEAEVMGFAQTIMLEYPNMAKDDAYAMAFNEISKLDEEVRLCEPKRALNGGQTGLDCYKHLAPQFPNLLTAEGLLFLEIGFGQKKQILGIMKSNNLELIKIEKDLAQRDRCLILSHKHC